MAQLPLEPCRTCGLSSLRRVAMAAGIMAVSVLLISGCARHSKPSASAKMSPEARAQANEEAKARAEAQAQAKAQANARIAERQQMQREATALNQAQKSLLARAATNEQKANQLRAAARPIENEGLTNIAAGEAMYAEADRLQQEALAMRDKADEMSMRARELMASMPKD